MAEQVSSQLTAEQVKEWFNQTFFNEGKEPKRFEEVAITLRSKHGVMVLPTLQLNHEHTLGMIVHAVYEYVRNGGPIVYSVEQEQPATNQQGGGPEPDPEVPVNFDHFTWRKQDYMVEHYKDGKESRYRVVRMEDNKELTEKHKNRARMIKLFQEKYPEPEIQGS
jgi:hypothetical protein